VWQAILPVRMGLRPMKGDESLAEVRLSPTSFYAWTVRHVADRVNRKGEAFDRAGGLSRPPSPIRDEVLRPRCGVHLPRPSIDASSFRAVTTGSGLRGCDKSLTSEAGKSACATSVTLPKAIFSGRILLPVKQPPEQQNSRLMRGMFSSIAPRYDFITRAFSYGMDGRWKRLGVSRADLPPAPVILDLASGTGDFSKLVGRQYSGAKAVAVDITERMLRLAKQNGVDRAVCADAAALPFDDGSFDCVFVGYGLRNFPDLRLAVSEIERVTRPGGLLVSLDFFLPVNPLFRRLYLGYLYVQGTFWGLLLHGRPRTYTYIPDSLRSFVSVDELSSLLRQNGYRMVDSNQYILGGIGLHWATKES
jgi:demethylmenaquinone methyltransferase / 2-methoxy-6-polyprenyl-1,4-benzoquinol methylase